MRNTRHESELVQVGHNFHWILLDRRGESFTVGADPLLDGGLREENVFVMEHFRELTSTVCDSETIVNSTAPLLNAPANCWKSRRPVFSTGMRSIASRLPL